MSAKELLEAGNLSGAIEQLTQDVKSNPRDLKSRIFLFELLCFAGDLRENKFEELEELLQESAGLRASVKGKKDGTPFDDFHDGDDLLSPFLEIIFQNEYYWLPFEQIARLEVKAPHTLRDLLWTSATIELHNRAVGEAFIPALYLGSHTDPDDLVKLGRMTQWKSVGNEILLGFGQRTFYADETESPLLEIRTIEFAI
jgi:type VI secretion system protein ImpE